MSQPRASEPESGRGPLADHRGAVEPVRPGWSSVLECIPHLIWTADPEGRPQQWNRHAVEYLGFAGPQEPGRFADVVHPEDVMGAVDAWARAIRDRSELTAEHRLRRADGEFRWHAVLARPTYDATGVIRQWIGTATDIDQLRRAERRSAEAAAVLDTVRSTAPVAFGFVDETGSVRMGPRPEDSAPSQGVTPGGIGRSAWPQIERLGQQAVDTGRSVEARAGGGRPGASDTAGADHADATDHADDAGADRVDGWSARSHPVRLGHEIVGVVVVADDVCDHAAVEARLRRRMLTDPLTGLPNRALFVDRLHEQLTGTSDPTELALLTISVNRLNVVNDGLGRSAGDQILLAVVSRLRAVLAPGDTLGRSAGDEFVVLADLSRGGDAASLAERIAQAMADPIEVGDRNVSVSCSIGIVTPVPSGNVAEDLLRDAATAASRARQQGGPRYLLFDESARAGNRARFDLEIDLRDAIERGQLRVAYQPTVDLASGRVTGAEALMRWDHPERGVVPPLDFVGLAEESGLIVPIGSWVLGQACAQLRVWQDGLGALAPRSLSVNISGRQLVHGDLAERVAAQLDRHGLDPSNLCLEITESVLMDNAPGTVDALGDLRDLGVRLSVDDFGTGYSSLLYLRDFPVHELKIDRLFVAGLGRNRDDTAIVEGVIALAHGLNLTVVAEGVETLDQAESLRHLGSDVGQGFFWSRPSQPEELSDLLRTCRGAPGGPVSKRRSLMADHGDDVPDHGGDPAAPPARRTVLLVDDARPERELLGIWLHETSEFVVAGEAADGTQGVDLAVDLQPDLVVLDMSMPGMDGLQTLRQIQIASPASKVVILSGLVSPGLVKAAVDHGAVACLDKSIGPARLIEELLCIVETMEMAVR